MWHWKKPRLDEFGRSELHYAAAEGDVDKAQTALAAGADVNLADKGGWTPLHAAAQSQSAPVVGLLVKRGADVHAMDRHGNTPLWRAVFAYRNDPATIEALRAAGADPFKKNAHGISPLSLARTIANYDVAKCFADLPADAADTT
jgi:ankyrin repeat protein